MAEAVDQEDAVPADAIGDFGPDSVTDHAVLVFEFNVLTGFYTHAARYPRIEPDFVFLLHVVKQGIGLRSAKGVYRRSTEEEMEGGTLWRRLWLGVAGYGVEAFFLQLVRVELDFSRGSMKLKRDTLIGVDGLFLTVDHTVFFQLLPVDANIA